jgi:glycosyltransferase involved in cell wall biosynthesis
MSQKMLKIAEVAPVMVEIPPERYGGIESIVNDLSVGLSDMGHEVTVFGAGGSKVAGKNIRLVPCSPWPTTKDLTKNREYELSELRAVIDRQHEFDLIHFHYEPLIGRILENGKETNLFSEIVVPKVHTFHNTTYIDANIDYYRSHQDTLNANYVFISKDHRAPLSFLANSTVIYNGIHLEPLPYNDAPEDYLLFAGRLTEVKGVLEAIEVAKMVGKKLIIFGKVDSTDVEFYENKVKPLIDGTQIVYLGEVSLEDKINYYRNAECLLFPISWHEPFGLVLVEAMACGTPVIGFGVGSVGEIVDDGKTGFVVSNVQEMAQRVNDIKKISRQDCRDRVESLFTTDIMVAGYEKLYRSWADR